MLKSFLLLSFVTGAACVNNLHQNTAYVQSSVARISETLKGLDPEGSVRQVAINALLRSVKGAETLTPEHIETLKQVKEVLAEILELLRNTTASNQGLLDGTPDDLNDCNNHLSEGDLALENNATELNVSHYGCRADEQVLFEDDAETCGKLLEFLAQVRNSPPNCEPSSINKVGIPIWQLMFDEGKGWFTVTISQYNPKKTACVDSTHALTVKTTECDGVQAEFETVYCSFRSSRITRCNYIDSCYDTKRGSHESYVDYTREANTRRQQEAGVIIHVDCLLDKLINEEDLTNAEQDCPVPPVDQLGNYTVTFPTLPNKTECSVNPPIETYPGEPDFHDHFYDQLPVNAPATVTGITC